MTEPEKMIAKALIAVIYERMQFKDYDPTQGDPSPYDEFVLEVLRLIQFDEHTGSVEQDWKTNFQRHLGMYLISEPEKAEFEALRKEAIFEEIEEEEDNRPHKKALGKPNRKKPKFEINHLAVHPRLGIVRIDGVDLEVHPLTYTLYPMVDDSAGMEDDVWESDLRPLTKEEWAAVKIINSTGEVRWGYIED